MARSAALPRARASRKSLAEADEALTAIGLPWAIMAREALHAFVIINRATALGAASHLAKTKRNLRVD
jgi:hypothetical protein